MYYYIEFEMFKKQEYDFMEFVYSKAIEFTERHDDFIDQVILLPLFPKLILFSLSRIIQRISEGFASFELVLENIETKPENALSDQEKELLADLQELRRINQVKFT